VREGRTNTFRLHASLLPCAVDALHQLPEKTLWYLFAKKLLIGQLVTMLREERTQRQETEKQQAHLLEDYIQRDIKIAQLEAELAQYREYLEGLRISIQQQEHGN